MNQTFYAPATIANVGAGFDLLGLALAPVDGSLLGDSIRIEECEKGIEFSVAGPWKHKLPVEPESNIAWQCANYFLARLPARKKTAGIRLELIKNLPVGSGLGSSASSIVATFFAMNQHFSLPFSSDQLLLMMGEFEGRVSGSVHYDNVAPSFHGGMQLLLQTGNRICEPVPWFKDWFWVIAYPGIALATSEMRALLPERYERAVAIEYGRNLAAFIHASYRNDVELAAAAMKDVLAEPFRSPSIPGFIEARTALKEIGMLATGISGSGPTLFSVTDDPQKAEMAETWLSENFLKNDESFSSICRVDPRGARII